MSSYPAFKELELSDKPLIDSLLAESGYRGTEYCFTTLFTWAPMYRTRFTTWEGHLIIRSGDPGSYQYIFPAGRGTIDPPSGVITHAKRRLSAEEIRAVLALMEADAKKEGSPFSLFLSAAAKEAVEEALPGRYSFEAVRNSFDYIYEASRLISLSGKKYQPKRNFISRFKATDPSWAYESIDYEDKDRCLRQLEECREMNELWCQINGCIHNHSMEMEACAVRKALENFIPLQLRGGLLRQGGKVVAYTIGEKYCDDGFIVHIEKAFSDVVGSYPMINQSFLSAEYSRSPFLFVNREDDAGDEGLRKAKLSYHPICLLEKFVATPAGL